MPKKWFSITSARKSRLFGISNRPNLSKTMCDNTYTNKENEGGKIMKTYKVVYSIANKPGRHVAFYEAACADFARMRARDELGGWDIVTIWEVTEVNF